MNTDFFGRSPRALRTLRMCFLDGLWLHDRACPHRVEQLIVRHQTPRTVHEILEDRKGLGRHQDAFRGTAIRQTPQTLVRGVQPERRKHLHLAHQAFTDA